MKLVITASATHLCAKISAVFERCPYFLFVDTEHAEDFEVVANPFRSSWGGADILCAQFIISHGAEAILSGCCSANAKRIFQRAHLKVFADFDGEAKLGINAIKNETLFPSDLKR